MKYYFAPLEGITGFAFRNVHNKLFPGVDLYYSPFVSAKQTHAFETKEKKDVDPVNNTDLKLMPQIMANRALELNWAADELKALGYETVNLNLGCPMPTIVTKRKGSGMLADLDNLRAFLDDIFDHAQNGGPRISIKTRLGKDTFEDASKIIELYNNYPLAELIIHPRCQKDLYKNPVNLDVFEECVKLCKHDVCYNGDIFTKSDFENVITRFDVSKFPQIKAVMLGRGMIANPALLREIKGGAPLTKKELKLYHDSLYQNYEALNYGFSPLLHRMKELWFYIGELFVDSEKAVHKIRIAKTVEQYKPAVEHIFANYKIGKSFRGFTKS